MCRRAAPKPRRSNPDNEDDDDSLIDQAESEHLCATRRRGGSAEGFVPGGLCLHGRPATPPSARGAALKKITAAKEERASCW